MDPRYPRVYAPVLRSPLLFHHNTGLCSPTYNPVRPRVAFSATNLNFPHPTLSYRPQARYTVQAPLPYNSQLNPYYSSMPQSMAPPLVPISSYSYSTSTVSYASTVSSKGLSIILIATLILVALDLVIVRPQKR